MNNEALMLEMKRLVTVTKVARRLLDTLHDKKGEGVILDRRSDLRVALEVIGE